VLKDGTTIEYEETTLFLYKGGFDPSQPVAHLYAGNDDTNAFLDPPLLYSSLNKLSFSPFFSLFRMFPSLTLEALEDNI